MGKRKLPDASLKGKKPINTAKRAKKSSSVSAAVAGGTKEVTMTMKNPSHITNKLKRSEMYGKYLQQKKAVKKEVMVQRVKEAERIAQEQGHEGPVIVPKQTPRTLENSREIEPTMVLADDVEVAMDQNEDEFAPYFFDGAQPKVLITTRPRPSQNLFYFIADLQKLVPSLHFYPRKSYSIKEICQFASNRNFTHLIVLNQNKKKQCNGMTISHLRPHAATGLAGPTAHFKVSNVVTSQNIPFHGASTHHLPELNLHGFATRLGQRVGRLLGSIFPHDAPQFEGRQVATFHNQRDYIFVRQHRYIFDEANEKQRAKIEADAIAKQQQQQQQAAAAAANGKSAAPSAQPPQPQPLVKTRLQELGPRFTLKMRWLQEGTFDTKFGEYEWIHKRKEMDTTRRRFHL
jgi:ribosome production factor 1